MKTLLQNLVISGVCLLVFLYFMAIAGSNEYARQTFYLNAAAALVCAYLVVRNLVGLVRILVQRRSK
ncbi:MAG: hypothetical protein GY717_19300 [Rhodobacteraceae bacterium]|nr:hypothetical protein [Paracoccaceae bacterium]